MPTPIERARALRLDGYSCRVRDANRYRCNAPTADTALVEGHLGAVCKEHRGDTH